MRSMFAVVFALLVLTFPTRSHAHDLEDAGRLVRGVYFRAGYEEAMAAFHRAALDSDSYVWEEQIFLDLAHLMLSDGQTERALELLNLTEKVCVNSSMVNTSLSWAHLLEGNADQARHHLQRALDLNPDNAAARRSLDSLDQRVSLLGDRSPLEIKYMFSETDSTTGPYLGQEPPGTTPRVFAPGLISTELREISLWVSEDGTTVCFAVSLSHTESAVLIVEEKNGQWESPRQLDLPSSFSIPYLPRSPDGSRIYFSAPRRDPETDQAGDHDIFYVQREDMGWTEPIRLGDSINTAADEMNPFVSTRGDLYFASNRPGGLGSLDIYRATWNNGEFDEAENLGSEINTSSTEWDFALDPGGEFGIIGSNRESIHRDSFDLFVNFRDPDGSWGSTQNLGPAINSDATELGAFISADGKYLFFHSEKSLPHHEDLGYGNGLADIYWVSTECLVDLGRAPHR